MAALGIEAARVVFVHDLTAVQHQYAISVIGVEGFLPGHGLVTADRREGEIVNGGVQ